MYEKKFRFWVNSLLQSEDQYGVSPSHRRVETVTRLVLDKFYDVNETVAPLAPLIRIVRPIIPISCL